MATKHKTSRADAEPSDSPTTENTTDLDDETWTRYRQQAAQSGVSIDELMKQQETDPSPK